MRVNVDEALLREAVETIETLRAENTELRKALGNRPQEVRTAISKALRSPNPSQPRPAIFMPRDVQKTRQVDADRKAANRRELRKAKGLRESPYDTR